MGDFAIAVLGNARRGGLFTRFCLSIEDPCIAAFMLDHWISLVWLSVSGYVRLLEFDVDI